MSESTLLLIITAAISAFVLAISRLSPRVVIASLGFGQSGALIFVTCYLLWAIGGIAFRNNAGQLAIVLTLTNMGTGIAVVRKLSQPLSPPERDVPAETEQR